MCGRRASAPELAEASWLAPEVKGRIHRAHPSWVAASGACAGCVQRALLTELLERPEGTPAHTCVLPTPLHMRADPRYAGRGVTLALVDSGFHPHPDLTLPHNRICAWADAGVEPVRAEFYTAGETPVWPGSDAGAPAQWHGLMTSAIAAGNGWLSHGLYRGLAGEADLILVQVREPRGRITNQGIARALRWLGEVGPGLGLRVVNLSVGGDPMEPGASDPVDEAVSSLVSAGVTVVAAAGNDGQRRLVPPASSPAALTVGGLDDKNAFDPVEMELWHSSYGPSSSGAGKPELVAPSIWVVAPLLPGTSKAAEAKALFEARAAGDAAAEAGLEAMKFITPHYHHVDGTSVAAPLVAGVAACLLEADPTLTPERLREILMAASRPVPGAPAERQGAGALDAGRAAALVAPRPL